MRLGGTIVPQIRSRLVNQVSTGSSEKIFTGILVSLAAFLPCQK